MLISIMCSNSSDENICISCVKIIKFLDHLKLYIKHSQNHKKNRQSKRIKKKPKRFHEEFNY